MDEGGIGKPVKGRPKNEAEEARSSDELDELKHNLKVSFSRMKEDILSNRQETGEMRSYIEDLVKTNRLLLEQVSSLKDEIRTLKEKPRGLKTELMRSLSRNKKLIIKQRILDMAMEGRFSTPELKERVVDDRNYCSKASFYRYIDELRAERKIDLIGVEGREVVVSLNKDEGGKEKGSFRPELAKKDEFI